MTPKEVFIAVLLGLAVVTELLSVLGLILMPNPMARMHYLTPATALGPVLVAGALVTKEALDHQGIVAVLVAVFFAVFGAVLTHATARAARIRQHGDWRIGDDERVRRP